MKCFLIFLWLLHYMAQRVCMLSQVRLFATPGSSVQGILQERILERCAIFFSRGEGGLIRNCSGFVGNIATWILHKPGPPSLPSDHFLSHRLPTGAQETAIIFFN